MPPLTDSLLSRAVIVACLVAGLALAQAPSFTDAITEPLIKKHVRFIADDNLAGRDTGSVGHDKATDYIRKHWKEAGIKSLVEDGSYFQRWAVRTMSPNYQASTVTFRRGNRRGTLKGGGNKDEDRTFEIFPFSGSGTASANVVFVGYGAIAPEYDYDDYAQVEVKDRIVVALRHEPRENDDSGWNGRTNTKHAGFEEKYNNAVAQGAAAFICVTDPLNHRDGQRGVTRQTYPRRPVAPRGAGAAPDIPAIWMDYDAFARVVGGSKVIEDWQKTIDDAMKPHSFVIKDLSMTVTIKLDSKDVPTRNVCGWIEGSDPTLKDEFVVIGAHSDHVGVATSGRDKVFNGADDNGSGTATLIAVAEALATAEPPPKRSIIFLSFSGEELGLLGSEFYVANPLRPIEKIVAMLNMDMVGRNFDNGCEVIGTQFSADLRKIISQVASDLGMTVEYKNGTDHQRVLDRSDQAPFLKRDRPVAFFTTGLHNDYHTVGDHVDKLKTANMAKIGRLVALVAFRVADAQAAPGFVRD